MHTCFKQSVLVESIFKLGSQSSVIQKASGSIKHLLTKRSPDCDPSNAWPLVVHLEATVIFCVNIDCQFLFTEAAEYKDCVKRVNVLLF